MILDRLVAIKVPAKEEAATLQISDAVFAREAKALATLQHPNIISLYDYYRVNDRPALVMRYIGQSLSPGMDNGTILKAAADVASALDYCAELGLAHRDIKPANILLDERGRASVIDFGIAAQFDDAKSWAAVIGSMPFIGPELLMGMFEHRKQVVSPVEWRRYDQFSFGVTLYQALTGKLPHDKRTNMRRPEWESCTAYRLMIGEEPVPANERTHVVTPAAHEVLRKMMAVDPDHRFMSCCEAVASLDDAMSGRGVGHRKIFLSYATSDRDYVLRLVCELRRRGMGVWWDNDMVRGLDWEEQVEEQLLDAEVMLLILSPDAARSPEVKYEWRYWINLLRKPVLTAMIRDCRIPYRLYSRQHILANDREPEELAVEVVTAIEQLLPDVLPVTQVADARPEVSSGITRQFGEAYYTAAFPPQEQATQGMAMPSKRVSLELPPTLYEMQSVRR
jgi:hypothetical protein